MNMMMLLSSKNKKKNSNQDGNRILISVTVMGSAGPIRFVVNEKDLVVAVIDTALKAYAKEGRLPVLGSNLTEFILFCPFAGHEALCPWETIGAHGARNFMLCKKPELLKKVEEATRPAAPTITRKGSGGWKSWINKSLNSKISSH